MITRSPVLDPVQGGRQGDQGGRQVGDQGQVATFLRGDLLEERGAERGFTLLYILVRRSSETVRRHPEA